MPKLSTSKPRTASNKEIHLQVKCVPAQRSLRCQPASNAFQLHNHTDMLDQGRGLFVFQTSLSNFCSSTSDQLPQNKRQISSNFPLVTLYK